MRYLISVFSLILTLAWSVETRAVDMQAPMTSAEAQNAYSDYLAKQAAYYVGAYHPDSLRALCGTALFARLNALMGATCRLRSGYSYDRLRTAYVNVDRDLNQEGNIIGTYNGASFSGTWDSGRTWNREHSWPQSKGASKGIPMGYDMQSVRPTHTSVNSTRGNDGFGTGNGYYDPDDETITNPLARRENHPSYRGDAARIVLYCYLVYGERDGHKSAMYNGNAQLLQKVGTSTSASNAVFESIEMLLAWHEADPPSLIEMVRNDGAEEYQGNRNPLIDFPELARALFSNQPSAAEQTTIRPNHRKVLRDGAIYIMHNQQIYDIYGRRR